MLSFTRYYLLSGVCFLALMNPGVSFAGPGHNKEAKASKPETLKASKETKKTSKAPRLIVDKPKKETGVHLGKTAKIEVVANSGSDFSGEVTLTLEHEEWDEFDKKKCLKTQIEPKKSTFKKNEKKTFIITLSAGDECPVLSHQHLHMMLWLQRTGQETQYLQNIELGFSTLK